MTLSEQDLLEIAKCKVDPNYFAGTYLQSSFPSILGSTLPYRSELGTSTDVSLGANAASALHQMLFFPRQTLLYVNPFEVRSHEFLQRVQEGYRSLPEFLRGMSRPGARGRYIFALLNGSVLRTKTVINFDFSLACNRIWLDLDDTDPRWLPDGLTTLLRNLRNWPECRFVLRGRGVGFQRVMSRFKMASLAEPESQDI